MLDVFVKFVVNLHVCSIRCLLKGLSMKPDGVTVTLLDLNLCFKTLCSVQWQCVLDFVTRNSDSESGRKERF